MQPLLKLSCPSVNVSRGRLDCQSPVNNSRRSVSVSPKAKEDLRNLLIQNEVSNGAISPSGKAYKEPHYPFDINYLSDSSESDDLPKSPTYRQSKNVDAREGKKGTTIYEASFNGKDYKVKVKH